MNSQEFALHVVQKLQHAGFQALWAGGCVRDQLLGLAPKDYDVATLATPEQVRKIFGHKRTLPIGASFGVITVLGPKLADPIEVATFRRDAGYSDGRRPDSVQFTDAREDALRRDFTINGMFFDPVNETVLDFVGGKDDLASGLIRAIGDADKRIEEDKLRMLRGVRFAAKYGFSIENQTLHAIQQRASELSAVSNERIGAEMQRMLTDASRAKALELLRQTNLLPQVLLDKALLAGSEATWEMTLKNLAALRVADFCAAAAILVEPIATSVGVEKIADHWKLSNQQKKAIKFALTNKETLEVATNKPWSVIQPLLLSPFIESTLAVLEAVGEQQAQDNVSFLRKQLAGKSDQLDPLPLITGNDLIANGVQPGPAFKRLLEICRAKQLDGELKTSQEALDFVKDLSN